MDAACPVGTAAVTEGDPAPFEVVLPGAGSETGTPFRTVRLGSSARIVLIPTRIASLPCRNFIPAARAFSPVIHFDSPRAVAIFPSNVIAALTVTNGVR